MEREKFLNNLDTIMALIIGALIAFGVVYASLLLTLFGAGICLLYIFIRFWILEVNIKVS